MSSVTRASKIKKEQKSPPKSALSTGKFKRGSPFSGGHKDDRHVLHFVGVKQGVTLFWPQKYNAEEEPYLAPDFNCLKEDEALMESLNISAILFRKGEDGGTAKKQTAHSAYNWHQFASIVGDANNTSSKRKLHAQKIVEHLNRQATTANYQYPRRFKVGEDFSGRPLAPCDTYMLDADVIGLMLAAYPDTPLHEVMAFKDIMRTFWSDVGRGKDVVQAHVDATQATDGDLVDTEEENKDDDEEEEEEEEEANL